jgi:hypothetical protein
VVIKEMIHLPDNPHDLLSGSVAAKQSVHDRVQQDSTRRPGHCAESIIKELYPEKPNHLIRFCCFQPTASR